MKMVLEPSTRRVWRWY